MIKVLRVENDERIGMYASRPKAECIHSMQSVENHPCPNEDAALSSIWYEICKDWEFKNDWHFAFSDLRQLRNWIYKAEWRYELAAAGLKISVYEVTHYHLGDTQCIFKWEGSQLIERFGFDEIYTKEI
jgi:hypothetical protein